MVSEFLETFGSPNLEKTQTEDVELLSATLWVRSSKKLKRAQSKDTRTLFKNTSTGLCFSKAENLTSGHMACWLQSTPKLKAISTKMVTYGHRQKSFRFWIWSPSSSTWQTTRFNAIQTSMESLKMVFLSSFKTFYDWSSCSASSPIFRGDSANLFVSPLELSGFLFMISAKVSQALSSCWRFFLSLEI